MNEKYKDMLRLPHPVSATHPRMSLQDRAAQFSPFAALTGYEDALKETARLTDRRIELDEDTKAMLDLKQQILADRLSATAHERGTYGKDHLFHTGHSEKRRCLQHFGRMRAKN